MKELIGLLILAAIVLGLTAVALYYILRKIAEKQFLSGPVDVLNLFFSGDRRIRSAKGINRACLALMRRAYVAAPNGPVAMSQAFIRIHPEDLDMIRTTYGQEYYRRELASYHQKVARRRGWKYPNGESVLDVRFTGDADRPVAAPALHGSSSAVPRGAGTRVFGPGQTKPFGQTTKSGRMSDPSAGTEPAARFTGPGVDRLLFGSQAPYLIGRGTGNDLMLIGPTIHKEHARLDFADGRWTLLPLKLVNSTKVNGMTITAAAELTGNSELSFGSEAGYRFSEDA